MGDLTFNGLKLGARLGGLSGNAVAEIVQVVQAKIHFGHRTWFVGLCAPNPLGMKHGDFGHIVCYDRRWNVRGRWRSGQEGHADPTALGAGFTLIELLVVLAILGLLAAIAVPQVLKYLGRAKEDVVNVQIQALETSLDLFDLDLGRYPTDQEGLNALVQKPAGIDRWNGPYVAKATSLVDPWGRPYVYRQSDQAGNYLLYSLGPDGNRGPPANLTLAPASAHP